MSGIRQQFSPWRVPSGYRAVGNAVLGFLVLGALIGPSAIGLELVRDGKPVACIIVPSQPLPVESYAAKELQYHVESATGSELPIVSEDQQVPLGVHIFLGHCKATQEARVDPTSLPGNSYILKTIGHDLYLVGKDSRGDPLDADTHEGTLDQIPSIVHHSLPRAYLDIPRSRLHDRAEKQRFLPPGLCRLDEVLQRHFDDLSEQPGFREGE